MNQTLKDALLELDAELNRRIVTSEEAVTKSRKCPDDFNFHLGATEANKSLLKFARYLKGKYSCG